MSCLNMRLPPAKKAWKSFTTKLQNKLRKLRKSKTSKKPKHQPNYILSSKAAKSPFLFKKRDRNRYTVRLLRSFQRTLPFKQRTSSFLCRKKLAPVYIDKLFLEPPVSELVAKRAKGTKLLDHRAVIVPETSMRGDEKGASRACAADDMWESLGFASPQLQGIDERAEQFISSFRAEMEIQELIARDL